MLRRCQIGVVVTTTEDIYNLHVNAIRKSLKGFIPALLVIISQINPCNLTESLNINPTKIFPKRLPVSSSNVAPIKPIAKLVFSVGSLVIGLINVQRKRVSPS